MASISPLQKSLPKAVDGLHAFVNLLDSLLDNAERLHECRCMVSHGQVSSEMIDLHSIPFTL